ncbi:hypothetical protein KKB83_05645 [Patescibacteria group bacterium]|nr:hypothetical protein [Patescibacteria group bacterium]
MRVRVIGPWSKARYPARYEHRIERNLEILGHDVVQFRPELVILSAERRNLKQVIWRRIFGQTVVVLATKDCDQGLLATFRERGAKLIFTTPKDFVVKIRTACKRVYVRILEVGVK